MSTKIEDHAAAVLREAADLVTGERNETHGDIATTFEAIAIGWEALLGSPVTPADVAKCIAWQKLVRSSNGSFNADDMRDLAGYAGIAAGLEKASAPPA